MSRILKTFLVALLAVLFLSLQPSMVNAFDFQNATFEEHMIDGHEPGSLALSVADFDGDGAVDIVSGGRELVKFSWWKNNGYGSFTEHIVALFALYDSDAADLDSDGDMDIAAAIGGDYRRVNWYENDGNGNFIEHYLTTFSGDDPQTIVVSDINGDGMNDIVVGAGHSIKGTLTVLGNNGDKTFARHDLTSSFVGITATNVGDINSDGRLDIVAVGNASEIGGGMGPFSWWQNNGNFSFTEHPILHPFMTGVSVAAKDFNQDGYTDILATMYSGGNNNGVFLWNNDGNQNFTMQTIAQRFGGGKARVTDIDGDGDFDFVETNFPANLISLWENVGNSNFSEYVVTNTFTGVGIAVAADINGNDIPDFVGVSHSPGELKWYETQAVSQPPNVSINGPYVVQEGNVVELTATGTDPQSSPVTYTWDLDNDGISETAGQTVQFLGIEGPSIQTVTVQVANSFGLTATATTTVTINNVAPSVGVITAPLAPIAINTTIHASVGFNDPGASDTHTALWNWGDGTTSAGIVTETNGAGTVSGDHTYITPGIYTLMVKVTDDDGDSGISSFQYGVVYHPDGGFVTGGGWFQSPAGAYAQDPSLSGKANFGFVSKYQHGAIVPTGQTEFQFNVANFTFHSSSYEWLVVAGSHAKYKGSGTINGAGDYGFMLTATDGSPDRFRIKIWDKSSNTVIYDNQMGASDDANATTILSGGSIVIHN